MHGKYTISVECTLSASHALENCPPCDRVHGHTWKVRAYWVFSNLDSSGMGVDFVKLKKILTDEIKKVYDHTHLNELPAFKNTAPTAENLARKFFQILFKKQNSITGGRLKKVEIWEGWENFVAYEED